MRVSIKKNITIDNVQLFRHEIGTVKAICRNIEINADAYNYLVDFGKNGILFVDSQHLDICN